MLTSRIRERVCGSGLRGRGIVVVVGGVGGVGSLSKGGGRDGRGGGVCGKGGKRCGGFFGAGC